MKCIELKLIYESRPNTISASLFYPGNNAFIKCNTSSYRGRNGQSSIDIKLMSNIHKQAEISESFVRGKILVLLQITSHFLLVSWYFTDLKNVVLISGRGSITQNNDKVISCKLLFSLVALKNSRDDVISTSRFSDLHISFSRAITKNIVTFQSLSLIRNHEGIALRLFSHILFIRSIDDSNKFSNIKASGVLDLVFFLELGNFTYFGRV